MCNSYYNLCLFKVIVITVSSVVKVQLESYFILYKTKRSLKKD